VKNISWEASGLFLSNRNFNYPTASTATPSIPDTEAQILAHFNVGTF